VRVTLTGRIWAGFTLSAMALIAVSTLWVENEHHARDLDELDHRTHQIVVDAGNLISEMKDAETGARGYVITGAVSYLEPYERALANTPEIIEHLTAKLPSEQSMQRQRIAAIERLVKTRMELLKQAVELRRDQGFDAARAFVLRDQDRFTMDQLRGMVSELISVQTELAEQGQTNLARQRGRTLLYIAAGAGGIVLILFLTSWATAANFRRRLGDIVQGAVRLGAGELDYRIEVANQDELSALGQRFNDMADAIQKVSTGLQAANDKLSRYAGTLRLLGSMAQRLQESGSIEEFAATVQRFAPDILNRRRGALFLANPAQTLVASAAQWGESLATEMQFGPGECWALRRGQPHVYSPADAEVRCTHVRAEHRGSYACVPLMGHGVFAGLLYFEFEDDPAAAAARASGHLLDEETAALSEDVSLALVNFRLRETQRSQSTRDALTSLFNRRYLDEALELEFERANRGRSLLCVIMSDIDHFKLFNDTHGHDCGDVVLQAIAQVLVSHARKGDIVCRYGGEEFTVVMPGATREVAVNRAEMLRQAVKERTITWQGQTLDEVTMSFGVASFPEDGETAREVVKAADEALFRAKAEGRDRVVLGGRSTSGLAPKMANGPG